MNFFDDLIPKKGAAPAQGANPFADLIPQQASNTAGKADRTRTGGEMAVDAAKGFGAGVVEGAIDLAGLPGFAREMAGSVGDLASPAIGQGIRTGMSVIPGFGGPTGEQAKQTIQGATGEFYQPQTTAGQYAKTVGEFVPSALAGPGGMVRKAAMAVVPGVLSEAGGQATQGTKAEPFVRAGLALGGSVGAGLGAGKAAVKGALKDVPIKTQPQAAKATNAAYKEIREAGVQYSPEDFGAMAGQLGQKLAQAGIMQADAPKTWQRVNMILEGAQAGRAPSWDEINSMRTGLGAVMRSSESTERAAAAMVFDDLAKFEKSAGMTSAASIAPEQLAQMTGKARDLALRNIKAKELTKREGAADTYISGTESGLKNQTASLLRSKYGTRMFSNPVERDALMEVAKGSPLRNALSTAGRAGFDWSKAGNISSLVPLAAGGGYGMGTGDWTTAGGILAAGSAAKYGARKIAERDIQRAIQLILAGPETQKKVVGAAQNARLRQRIAELLMAGGGAQQGAQ